jgi:hypothetical protein
MFEGPGFPKSLDEEVFKRWLENGRQSKLGYQYLLVVWDEYEASYQPLYVETRDEMVKHTKSGIGEKLIAAYDLYSESKIL